MNIHRFLFYLLLTLIPAQLSKYFFPNFALVAGIRVDYLAPVIYLTDLLIIAILAFWLLENVASTLWAANPLARQGRAPTAAVFILIGFVLINSSFAIIPIVALLKWLRILEVVFLVFYIIRTKPNVRLAIYCLLFAGFYSCILAWLQFVQQSSIGGIFWWIGERTFTIETPGIARLTFENQLFLRPYATFPHPNVLAGFLTSLIPLIFYVKPVNRYTRIVYIPTLLVFLATIFITFSQIAWIVALAIVIIFILKEKRVAITKQKITIGIVVTIIVSIAFYQFAEKESITRRVVLTNNALSVIRNNSLFGVGLNNFIIANQKETTITSYQDLQPVHSIYLLFVSETGIVGTALIFLLLRYTGKKVQIHKTSFYFAWSLGTLLIFGLFDHYPLTIHQTLLLGSVFVGFIFASNRVVKF